MSRTRSGADGKAVVSVAGEALAESDGGSDARGIFLADKSVMR
jgi:hypothetical protein